MYFPNKRVLIDGKKILKIIKRGAGGEGLSGVEGGGVHLPQGNTREREIIASLDSQIADLHGFVNFDKNFRKLRIPQYQRKLAVLKSWFGFRVIATSKLSKLDTNGCTN